MPADGLNNRSSDQSTVVRPDSTERVGFFNLVLRGFCQFLLDFSVQEFIVADSKAAFVDRLTNQGNAAWDCFEETLRFLRACC